MLRLVSAFLFATTFLLATLSQAATIVSLPLTFSTTSYSYTSFTLLKDSALTFSMVFPSGNYSNNDRAMIWILDMDRAFESRQGYSYSLKEYSWWLASDNGKAQSETLQLQAGTYTVRVGASSVLSSATLSLSANEALHNDGGEDAAATAYADSPVLASGNAQAATLGYNYVSAARYGYPESVTDSEDAFSFTPSEDGTVSYTVSVSAIHRPYENSGLYANIFYADTAYGIGSAVPLTTTGGRTVGPFTVNAGQKYAIAISANDLGTHASYALSYSFTPTATSSSSCSSTTLSLCTSMGACTAANGYWNFDWCGGTPQGDPSHYDTYCQQGYTQYCGSGGLTISDWIPRTDIAYQSIATELDDSMGYRLNGGAWSNARPNSSGQYDGNGVQTSAAYNFIGKTIYGEFTVHGAGEYASWHFRPFYFPSHHMNSNHSYGGGLLIPDDTRIYATFAIAENGQWSLILANGNYEHLGGTVLHRESGMLTSDQRGHLANTHFLVSFDDNYAGASAYMLIHEVRVGETGAAANVSDCLFNWAERQYPSLFMPSGTSSATLGEYYYRYYSHTNAYLATHGGNSHLYYLGPATGNVVADLGPASGWFGSAGCQ